MLHNVPHETVVVDDGSSDRTWQILQELKTRIPALAPVQKLKIRDSTDSDEQSFMDRIT
jgi:cellulose synthase/poly-beta-1,6-N-acetylglucosamine synthase-like glycosyltransferase